MKRKQLHLVIWVKFSLNLLHRFYSKKSLLFSSTKTGNIHSALKNHEQAVNCLEVYIIILHGFAFISRIISL